ncbi:pilus assembly protein TadG-related protein [Phytopseudomonas dryadis]|uniref:Putative Flp pilus-assembly TadG-like N-terminal domain-containing protein n=1 Tax=Phytopseudomonas dryadis TaxID=2487520 RepID=A0A4Q9R0D6_9GAMM|nr:MULTISPECIES: pilus assembly protein TadG-related protein [Pseudomonas]TBU92106.1 hypothetical protein DNK44_13060 [Pseudomonas dryadis]TBV05045.1 hypothetical protein DNK34_13400 [Pseudomonas dryadis]TBV16448.1 hypothetical protein DNK41_15255 [Pseudomonas sp. FRB 230]
MNHSGVLHRQRGVFSIISAATLVMAILFLALVVDSGRLYLEQRNLQRIADTAALEAISRLEQGNCSLDTANARLYAQENAASYGFPSSDLQSLSASCVSISILDGLRINTPDAGSGRAVEVITSNRVPASIIVRTASLFGFPGNATVRLQAVAVAEKDSDPLAVFSVGAQLLGLNANGLVPKLLEVVGVNVNTLTLLDSSGLANAQITPSGLLQALGVDLSINQLKALSAEGLVQLVDTRIGLLGLQDLIEVSAELISHDQTLAAEVAALGNSLIGTQLESARVNLLATADRPGLLQLVTGPDQPLGSALDARVNLGDVLSTGLLTAAQGRGLLVDQLNLLNGTLTLAMGIVEPPSIGIGPVGTTAYNAQVRLQVNTDTSNLPVLGSLLNFLGTSVKLPLIIDLVNARGELSEIDCSRAAPQATIDVESRIGNICIGSMPSDTLWSTRTSCTEASLQDESLVRLLNIDLVRGRAAIPLLGTGANPVRDVVTLAEQESEETGINNLALGSSLTELLQQVLNLIKLGIPQRSDGSAGFNQAQATQIADRYLTTLNYSRSAIREQMTNDGLNWKRPGACVLVCLADTTMPNEWYGNAPANCASNRTACRNTLISSLQSKAQSGLVGSIVGGVFDLVGNLVNTLTLGLLGLGDDSQPLLMKILDPILSLLKPLLDSVGSAVSTLLASLGLELGKSEINVHSISCGIPRLVQ